MEAYDPNAPIPVQRGAKQSLADIDRRLDYQGLSGRICRHYNGDYTLGISYWMVGAFISNMIGGMISILIMMGLTLLSFPVAGFAMGLTFTYVTLFWTSVGIWRSSEKHVSRGGLIFWALMAKIMIVFGIFIVIIQTGATVMTTYSNVVEKFH